MAGVVRFRRPPPPPPGRRRGPRRRWRCGGRRGVRPGERPSRRRPCRAGPPAACRAPPPSRGGGARRGRPRRPGGSPPRPVPSCPASGPVKLPVSVPGSSRRSSAATPQGVSSPTAMFATGVKAATNGGAVSGPKPSVAGDAQGAAGRAQAHLHVRGTSGAGVRPVPRGPAGQGADPFGRVGQPLLGQFAGADRLDQGVATAAARSPRRRGRRPRRSRRRPPRWRGRCRVRCRRWRRWPASPCRR